MDNPETLALRYTRHRTKTNKSKNTNSEQHRPHQKHMTSFFYYYYHKKAMPMNETKVRVVN